MKKHLLYICLFLGASAFAQESLVKAEVDTTNIRIGEQFEYKISINETQNVIIPKLANLNGLEVVDTLKIDTINNKLIQKYVLTGFDSGAFYIPRQQIFIKNQAYLTDSLLINVATVPIDTTKVKKYPIKGIKGEPYQFDDFKHYIWWALVALAVIGLAIYYFFFRKKKEEIEKENIPALPPYEEALEKLKNLDEKLLWQNNKIKQYYSELTDIVRGYIERELNIPALENTTDELIGTLTDFKEIDTIEVDKEIIQKLKELLQEADLVKFAKSKPLSHEIEQDRKDAESVINNIKTKPIEEAEDEVE
ncbi:BatD family protein [Tenacibaculum sp. 190130A14a]|uniref:Protein BatD n=1 Tax=Tenacibaculum polynesiense TaxID=3137857 RepID=A0ABM9PAA7_9FLAO